MNDAIDDRQKTKAELIAELEAMRAEVAALRATQRIAHVGNWQWERRTNITLWSDETYRIHGIEPGAPLPDWENEHPYLHPDDRETYQHLLERTRLGFSFKVDLRIVRPDGEIRYIEARGEPGIFDGSGELVELFGTVLDVTDRVQVEEKLRRSEFALREAQKVAHVGSWQWDRETNRVVWSEEIYRIHGIDPCQPPPDPQNDRHVHPEDIAIHERIVAASAAGQPYDVDLRIIRPDGEIRYVEARGAPGIFNDRGELVGLFGTVLDVTDRKLVEKKLRRSENNLARAQKIAHIGSWEYDIATDTTTWSEELYRIHQLNPSDPAPNAEEVARLIHPEDRRIDREFVTELLFAGKSCETDLRIIRQDGESRHIEIRGEPLRDAGGEIVRFVGTVLDITDRVRAEATLREANRRWRSLLDRVQLMVIGLNERGDVEYVNPFFLRITGYREEEVIGRCWFTSFIAPSLRREAKTHFFASIDGDSLHFHHEDRILTRTGGERVIAWNHTILQDSTGNRIGTISIGDDITEQYELECLKSEFISVVSHELRTPLTSMQAALSLLDGGLVDPSSEDARNLIRVATDGVDRLVRLVNDILDLERLESGQIQLQKQDCFPAVLIDTAIEQVKSLADRTAITFTVSAIDLPIYADGDRLIQVLTNLLGNAIRFSPTGSTIEVSAGVIAPDSILFKVSDRGRGIPENQLERVFDRFAQVDTSDSRERGGTGLGLAICRSIIQQHRGRIWAESSLAWGSTFYFTVPLTGGEEAF
jgi:PAS domain S-box-containing protein